MPCLSHMLFCWLTVRSEQLPMMYPSSRACRTRAMVMMPGGSPVSSVPSMSKLMSFATLVLPLFLQCQSDLGQELQHFHLLCREPLRELLGIHVRVLVQVACHVLAPRGALVHLGQRLLD